MSTVELRNLRKQFGPALAVADFSLDIADGEMVAFLGPSGCGKTTTLRMIAGFIEPSGGSVTIGGKDVTHAPANLRNTGMVFQRYALFPHMTVLENVEFGLKMRKLPSADRAVRIKQALDMVRLGELRDRYPRQLSGGQQQRVAIARALAIRPEVFLLDEPLSNLDAKLRVEVREEIRALQQELGLTTIIVTHDQEEALTIADRVAVMHDGRVQQVGSSAELYERPVNHFVADFLGRMNFLSGTVDAQGVFVTRQGTALGAITGRRDTQVVGIRPERLALSAAAMPDRQAIVATVLSTVYMGPTLEVRLETPRGDALVAHLPNNADAAASILVRDRTVHACFRLDDCVFFT